MKENHKIDSLFSQKLKNYEMAPSDKAWRKIELQNTPKRRKVVPLYWAAAACVFILTTIGIVRWEYEKTELPKEIAKLEQLSIHLNELNERLIKDEYRLKSKEELAKLEPSKHEKEKLALVNNTTISNLSLPKEIIHQEPTAHTNEDSPQEMIVTVKNEVEEKQIAVIEEVPPMNIVKNNRVVVAEIKVVMPVEENELPKKKRVRKIFKQLQNLKNGEDLNWDEIGVDPKNLIAKVDPFQLSSRN